MFHMKQTKIKRSDLFMNTKSLLKVTKEVLAQSMGHDYKRYVSRNRQRYNR